MITGENDRKRERNRKIKGERFLERNKEQREGKERRKKDKKREIRR